MKKLMVVLLAMALCLLCACGEAAPEESSAITTETQSTTESVTMVATTETQTVVPISVDPLPKSVQGQKLDLPAFSNNGGLYVCHNGATYYRQYNADCYEKSGLWGNPDEIPGAAKQMVRMDADGSVHKLFEDNGNGGFFIDSKGDFYMQRLLSNDDYTYQAYSLDPKGKLRWETNNGSLFALDEAREILISSSNDGIYAINCRTGKATLLAKNNEPICYDAAKGLVYHRVDAWGARSFKTNAKYDQDFIIRRVDWRGKNDKLLFSSSMQDLFQPEPEMDGYWGDWADVSHARKEGDDLCVYVESAQGSGNYFCSGALLRINDNGDWKDIPPEQCRPADYYGIYVPTYYATDGPVWQGEEKYDYVMYTSYDADGVDVLLREELNRLTWLGSYGPPEERYYSYRFVSEVTYSGNDIWFTIKDGDYDEEKAIGWRDAYAINHTYVYRKDGKTGEITLVYEY